MYFPEGQIRVFVYGQPVSMRLCTAMERIEIDHLFHCGEV
jgi:hypothetical protein